MTIEPIVGPFSATRPYWIRNATPVPSAPSASTASTDLTGYDDGIEVKNGVTSSSCTVPSINWLADMARWESPVPARVRRTYAQPTA